MEMADDDFFVYVLLNGVDGEHALSRLTDESRKMERRIQNELDIEFPLDPRIEPTIGISLLVDMPNRSTSSIVYTAMKKAIRNAREETADKEYTERLNSFYDILDMQLIETVYQPIVSLSDGLVFGYEALSRGPIDSEFHAPLVLFPFAER